ncbi:MAG: ABC transporter permease [Bacillota bacterium]
MLVYSVRRLLLAIPVLLGISVITFILMNVVPGDPVLNMLGKRADPVVVEKVRAQLGLNDPLYVQFFRFVANAARGDLGESYRFRQPVTRLILTSFPVTVKVSISAMLVAIAIGLTVGIVSAVKQYSVIDHGSMILALSGISAPIFWVALVAQYVFGLRLGILPISGYATWKEMVLPALVLGSRFAASIARLTRSSLLEVIRQDYVRTARAKGLAERVVIFKHALKNALIPVITVVGLQIGGLLTGSILTETIFGIPGLGRLAVTALNNRDFPLLQGTVLFTAFVYIMSNLAVDLSYAYVDPRIRLR